jgi:hypothetical protein
LGANFSPIQQGLLRNYRLSDYHNELRFFTGTAPTQSKLTGSIPGWLRLFDH